MTEKTYGFCESKCKHEVYTKDDFLIIDKEVPIGSTATDGFYKGTLYPEIPEDFTPSNSVIISMQYGNLQSGTSIANNVSNETTTIYGNIANGQISIVAKTKQAAYAGKKMPVRVVLMKVE